jgi:7-keto-8-aminopelargonate synthetase-like enzyme
MSNKKYIEFIKAQVDDLKNIGFLSKINIVESSVSSKSIIDGKEVIFLCSNNYLGLANHPEMIKAAKDFAEKYGAGIPAGRGVITMSIILELEKKLAEFKGEESHRRYLVFNV